MKTLSLLLVALALPLGAALSSPPTGASTQEEKPNRYIGAAKCKHCHSAEETGDQFGAWSGSKHAEAYDLLGTPEALEVAKANGVAEPQKAAECLRCHVTAYGEPEEAIKKGFDPTDGVSCETCHGPGEQHQKARMVAAMSGEVEAGAYTEIPEGEIIVEPGVETCLECHNRDNPTFERFCYFEYRDQLRHVNPKKPRTQEERDARLVCGCGDPCTHEMCTPAEGCGVKAGEAGGADK